MKDLYRYILKAISVLLLFGVLTSILFKLQRIGLFSVETAFSSFVGVSVALIFAGLFLYQFVYKKFSNSMMGGFM